MSLFEQLAIGGSQSICSELFGGASRPRLFSRPSALGRCSRQGQDTCCRAPIILGMSSARPAGVRARRKPPSDAVNGSSDKAPPAPTPSPVTAAGDTDPAVRVLRRFRLVFNAVKTHFQQVERRSGIGGAQLWALSVVRDLPGIGVSGLAQAMDIHQTTASNLVKAMASAGLIVARRDAADRRAARLEVTAAGVRVLKKAPGPFSGVLPQALATLDDETLARLDADLGRLLERLHPDKRAAGIPLAQM